MRILTNRALLTLSALLLACSVEAPTPKGTGRATPTPPRGDEVAEEEEAPRVLELTADLPDATINAPYVAALRTRKSIGKVRFELTSGSLPPGLTLSEAGEIGGTPSEFGDYAFGVTAEDYQGATGKADFTLSVTRKRWLVYEARPGDTAETRVFAVDLATPGLANHELLPDEDEYETFSLPPREVVWSDDGRLVALLGSNGAEAALFVIDLSGATPGAARKLAAGPAITVHGWAPGATRLAYSLDDTRSLLTVDAAAPEDMPQNHGTGDSASWATSEFLLCKNEDTGIFTVQFDETGRGETRATRFNEHYVVAQSFLSQVLLTRTHDEGTGNRSVLFDLNADASYGVIVDSMSSFIHASPNLRFGAHAPSDDRWAVVRLRPLTTSSLPGVLVSEVVPGSAAHWSPNSQWIVLDGSSGQIARLDDTISIEDPASFQPLGGEDGSLSAPEFSPDSRWLQFQRPWTGTFPGDDYEPAVQYLVNLDDEPLAPIAILTEPRAESAFSPNSRYFARASNQGDVSRTELFLIPLDSDLDPVNVTHADVAAGNVIENVTFTADSLALIYTDRASGAFLVDPEEAEGGARPQRLTRLTVTAVAEQK